MSKIADFEDNDFCYLDQNGNVNTPSFTNTSSPLDQNNPYTNYVKWEVYDPPGSTTNPFVYYEIDLTSHTFSGPGIYEVKMYIDADPANPDNCDGVNSSFIEVWENPVATIAHTDVTCNGFADGTATVNVNLRSSNHIYSYGCQVIKQLILL